MKKLISFAVAVVMLLSLSIPMTFAADTHEVAGPATTKGSVVGLKVDGVKVTSSADYIAKMGYEDDENWTAITSVQQFKDELSNGGNFYIAKPLVFGASDNVIYSGENEAICKRLTGTTETVLDGCGYSITGINFTNTKAMLFYLEKAENTLEIKNLSIGVEGNPVVMDGGSKFGFSVLGNVNGKSIVDNVSIWANLSVTNPSAGGNLAGFHGYAGPKATIQISNSEINGLITGETDTYALNVAGFVAGSKGKVEITNCVNKATMTGSETAGLDMAGFVANTSGNVKITNCENKATMTGSGKTKDLNMAGFVASTSGKVEIANCDNSAEINVTHTGDAGAAGAAGFFVSCSGNVDLIGCDNNKNITLNSNRGNGVAGIAITTNAQKDKTINLTRCVNNGKITQVGTARIGNGVAGILSANVGTGSSWFTLTECVNNGDVTGYSVVGGIGSTTYSYHNRKIFNSCTNNGTVTATGGTAHAIYGHPHGKFETSSQMETNTNTGMVYQNGETTGTKIMVNRYENPPMTATVYEDGTVETVYDSGKVVTKYADRTVTDYADGRIETVYNNGGTESVLSTVGGEAKAFLQMTDAYEAEGTTVNDVRFILVLSETEYAAISENITFKISFKLTDGTDRSLNFDEIEAFASVTAADDIYKAADGTVICGVVVEGVPEAEWTKCGLTYNGGSPWTYTK